MNSIVTKAKLLASRLAQATQGLPGARGAYIPLEDIMWSIPEYWWNISVRRHVIDMKRIRHACVERYKFNADLTPEFKREMHFAERYIYRLRDVKVDVISGACITDGHGFLESYGSLRRWLIEKPIRARQWREISAEKPVTVVHSTGYYHFLLEEVPRLLWILKHYPGILVFVSARAPQFVFNVLTILQNQGKIQESFKPLNDEGIFLKDYLFTAAEGYSGFVHRTDLSLMRDCFLPEGEICSTRQKRLYISRRNIKKRSPDNEESVEKIMREAEIEVVYPENISFSEQVGLFRNAHTVIAPHGAGLSNLLWCAPHTSVVEIFSPRNFNDCYARLSCQLSLDYTPLWAKPSSGWGIVDLDKLKDIL